MLKSKCNNFKETNQPNLLISNKPKKLIKLNTVLEQDNPTLDM